jgi:hypothetical protein
MESHMLKTCKQCGEKKTINQYRKYYNSRKGYYNTCKSCEKINTRYKYLLKKRNTNGIESLTENECAELNKLDTLFELLRANGLQPPEFGSKHRRSDPDIMNTVDSLMQKHEQNFNELQELSDKVGMAVSGTVPQELQEWLTKDLSDNEPEYLQEVVYDALKAKYRPQTGLDSITMLPMFDNTYRDILNKILERFDAYEEDYYSNKEE